MSGYFKIARSFLKITRPAGNFYTIRTLGPLGCNNGRRTLAYEHKPPPIASSHAKPTVTEHGGPPPPSGNTWIKGLIVALIVAALGGAMYYNSLPNGPAALPCAEIKRKKLKPKIERIPQSINEFPKIVPYLLIGGGTACFAAFRAIKSIDPKAKVLVITNESAIPYMRPPLSKEMWFSDDIKSVDNLHFRQWNGTVRSLFFEPMDFYVSVQELMSKENGGVAIAQGWDVTKIDAQARTVYLSGGDTIQYDKCLLATGASPRNLEVFEKATDSVRERVTLFRALSDFQDLKEVTKCIKHITVVGGGFLGSELACSLAQRGKENGMKVSQVFRETGNMGRVLPEYLSKWTTKKMREQGVSVVTGAEVENVTISNDKILLQLSNGNKLKTDHVIVAIGVNPNTALAKSSNLEIDPEHGGFIVNAELEARSNLYVAGDAACFYDVKLGRRRVEHHDHAVVSGRLAGENMTGAAKPYWHQSMIWSDLGPEVGYEAIGIVDSTLPTVGVFAKATEKDTPRAAVTESNEAMRSDVETKIAAPKVASNPDNQPSKADGQLELNAMTNTNPKDTIQSAESSEHYGKGVIFYLRDDIVVGIVLWNVFNGMQTARQIINQGHNYKDLNEVAKLFAIHEE